MKSRLERIRPFIVMDILRKARTLSDAIHMEVGEPDLTPSEGVIEAYERAIRDRRFYYTEAKGLLRLRERIAEYYLNRYGVEVSPDRIIITPGTSGAFLVVFGLLAGQGRSVIISDPSYPCYRNFSYFLGAEPVIVPAGGDTNYEIVPERLQDIEHAGGLLVSSPANPTGNLYGEDNLRALIEFCKKRGWLFISDEIYHGLVYDRKERSALEFSDEVVVINSFSKYFCMPGLRVGWMILPDRLVRKAEEIVQNVFIAANTPSQYAACEAFDDEHLYRVRETFRQRRDFLYESLKGLFGIDRKPEGAFYIWADISSYSDDSFDFCRRLLESKAVAITPGVDFGKNQTNHYVRFAYTRDIEELKEGVRRIREFLN
ncbi:MAG: aminotransferase class I/II-fold pyridoxal phosphate-dependent enzyme [Nitrospirae bacterium]|nr:MAG: aminotransferase class I/II-fold pyridoxal phosphate-dependent enzyme [Nitrospirota bacterium]